MSADGEPMDQSDKASDSVANEGSASDDVVVEDSEVDPGFARDVSIMQCMFETPALDDMPPSLVKNETFQQFVTKVAEPHRREQELLIKKREEHFSATIPTIKNGYKELMTADMSGDAEKCLKNIAMLPKLGKLYEYMCQVQNAYGNAVKKAEETDRAGKRKAPDGDGDADGESDVVEDSVDDESPKLHVDGLSRLMSEKGGGAPTGTQKVQNSVKRRRIVRGGSKGPPKLASWKSCLSEIYRSNSDAVLQAIQKDKSMSIE